MKPLWFRGQLTVLLMLTLDQIEEEEAAEVFVEFRRGECLLSKIICQVPALKKLDYSVPFSSKLS